VNVYFSNAAAAVFGSSGLDWVVFHTFRQAAEGIVLFENK